MSRGPTDGVPPVLPEPEGVEHVPVADGVALHARRWGGDGVPIVLVHGLASNARLWDGVATSLAASGHPVVAIDQRGHGRSSKPDGDYGMATVTDDLRTLIETLGLDRPVVAGQSWGGNVVVELAARFPGLTRGVAGVDGGTIELSARFDDWPSCRDALAPPRFAGTPLVDFEAMLRRSHPDWPESGIQGTLGNVEVRADGTVAPWLTFERHLLVLRGLWEHRPSERYPVIADPVLFLTAETPGAAASWTHDKRANVEAALAALADGSSAWLVGDHDLHAQHPERVAAILHDFATRGS